MKTIKELKDEVSQEVIQKDIEEMKLNNEPVLSEEELRQIYTSSKLKFRYEDMSRAIGVVRGINNVETQYEIVNDDILSVLRSFYTVVRNRFVKDVIVTVGKTKRFTDKQMGVICNELVRYNNVKTI